MLENDHKVLRYAAAMVRQLSPKNFSLALLLCVCFVFCFSLSCNKQFFSGRFLQESFKPEDKNRRFIISYRLADDMLTIYEPPVRNSGMIGGKFLERTQATKPGSSVDNPIFYTPADFSIGAVIHIFKHRYKIIDADEYVMKYLESHAKQYPIGTINSIRGKHGLPPTTTEELLESVPQGDTDPNLGKMIPSGIKTEYQRR